MISMDCRRCSQTLRKTSCPEFMNQLSATKRWLTTLFLKWYVMTKTTLKTKCKLWLNQSQCTTRTQKKLKMSSSQNYSCRCSELKIWKKTRARIKLKKNLKCPTIKVTTKWIHKKKISTVKMKTRRMVTEKSLSNNYYSTNILRKLKNITQQVKFRSLKQTKSFSSWFKCL